jgi:hypothetical protein
MSARDDAIAYASDLFAPLFCAHGVPFDDRAQRVVGRFVDCLIAAAREGRHDSGELLAALIALDPEPPTRPPRGRERQERERVPAIPQEVRR